MQEEYIYENSTSRFDRQPSSNDCYQNGRGDERGTKRDHRAISREIIYFHVFRDQGATRRLSARVRAQTYVRRGNPVV